ncbi:MAG TPA: hypothetical protein VFF52_17775 [Isosphaeraceae bacterium]|nr:hypothetical protein [Isosphaeraceae bacterium]
MQPSRDRQVLVWTMAALALGSLLAGAAMQTEPLRALCGCGTTSPMAPGSECFQDRMAEAQARAQLAASRRAPQEGRPETEAAITPPVKNAVARAPEHSTEWPAPPPPSDSRTPEPPKT